MIQVSPTMYDQMMILIQSLVHFTSVMFTHTLFGAIDDPIKTAFKNLKEIILAEDKEAFLEEFNTLIHFLGSVTQEGLDLTNEFIRGMAEYEDPC